MSVNKVSSTDGSLTPIAKNTSNSLSYLSDVDIISPSTGQILQYDGSKWGNGQPAYQINDTAETNLADDDKIPFYDTSASNKRSSTWSNIKAKLKTYFDTLYATISTVSGKQDKTLSAQVEGQSTVEGALGALSNADKATRQLIDDTVGWESYNEFTPSLSGSYDKGVTLTINANNTISLSGTATMTHVVNVGKFVCKANVEYILSGCPSGGGTGSSNYWLGAYIVNDISDDRKDIGNGCTFSFNVDTEITVKYRVPNGYVATGVTLYPMITKTIYKGFPYQPHHPSVDSCKYNRSEANILGAKNFFELNLDNAKAATINTWSGNVCTISGKTFTVDSKAGTITVGGTGTANVAFSATTRIDSDHTLKLKKGKYILSGRPNIDNTAVILRAIYTLNNVATIIVSIDSGTEAEFEITDSMLASGKDYCAVAVTIIDQRTNLNYVVKPMIRLATDTDSTYQHYAQTNRELTLSKMSYNDNNKVGAFNCLDINKRMNSGVSTTISGNNYTVTTADSTSLYPQLKITNPRINEFDGMFPAGTYRFMINIISFTGASGGLRLRKSAGVIKASYNFTETGKQIFVLTSNEDFYVSIMPRFNVTTDASVTFSDLAMCYLSNDTSEDYQPYAKTNVQLTTDKAEISAIGDDESGRTTASRQYSAGEYFYKDGQNCRTKTDVSSGATWTLNTNYEVKSIDSALNLSTQYRREINSSDNLNNITQVGYYSITTTPTNAPTGVSYCSLEVTQYANAGSSIMQRIYTAATIYQRRYSGSPASWSDWYKFEGTSGWTAAQTLSEGATSVTFTGLTSTYAYDLYSETADGTPVYVTGYTVSGTSITYNITAITSAQAGSGGTGCKAKLKCLY